MICHCALCALHSTAVLSTSGGGPPWWTSQLAHHHRRCCFFQDRSHWSHVAKIQWPMYSDCNVHMWAHVSTADILWHLEKPGRSRKNWQEFAVNQDSKFHCRTATSSYCTMVVRYTSYVQIWSKFTAMFTARASPDPRNLRSRTGTVWTWADSNPFKSVQIDSSTFSRRMPQNEQNACTHRTSGTCRTGWHIML